MPAISGSRARALFVASSLDEALWTKILGTKILGTKILGTRNLWTRCADLCITHLRKIQANVGVVLL